MANNELNLLDTDGENRAVRSFLMQYGLQGLTVLRMRNHMELSGCHGCWPEWVNDPANDGHLTKGGAGDWLRYLFALETTAPSQAEPSGAPPDLPPPCPQVLPTGWIRYTADQMRAYAKQAIEARGALSDAEISDLADDNDSGRNMKGNRLFSDRNLMSFVRAIESRILGQQGGGDAARDVLAERQRQVSVERWTPARDDGYTKYEMRWAAVCYALTHNMTTPSNLPANWPWASAWWKPTTERRNLVKAGALIIAEIERLDRAAIQAQAGDEIPPSPGAT